MVKNQYTIALKRLVEAIPPDKLSHLAGELSLVALAVVGYVPLRQIAGDYLDKLSGIQREQQHERERVERSYKEAFPPDVLGEAGL